MPAVCEADLGEEMETGVLEIVGWGDTWAEDKAGKCLQLWSPVNAAFVVTEG